MENNITLDYLRKMEMQKLESILIFCLHPWNYFSYGLYAEIIVDILEKKNADNQEQWEQKLKIYRDKMKLAKEWAEKILPPKEYNV